MALRQEVDGLLEYARSYEPYLAAHKEAYEIFEGDLLKFVMAELQKQFEKESMQSVQYRTAPINVLRKMVSKLSKIYSSEPMRSFSDGNTPTDSDLSLLEFYEESYKLDAKFSIANKYFNLFKSTFVEAFLDNGVPRLRAIPSHRFLVKSNDPINPMKVTHLMKLMGTDSEGKNIWYIYTDKEFLPVNSDGEILKGVLVASGNPKGINPYGKINGVYINRSDSELMPRPDSDLLTMTKLIPVLFTDLNFAVMFQCFSVMYGIDVNFDNVRMSPNAFWSLKSDPKSTKDPKVGILKPEADIDKVLNFILQQLTTWMSTRNIRAGSVGQISQDNALSGFSKAIDEMDTSEDRKEQVTFFEDAEEELFDLTMNYLHPVWRKDPSFENRLQFSKGLKVCTEFPDQVEEEPDSVIIDNQIKLVDKKLTTRKRAVMEIHEMTEKEAEEFLAEIDEESTMTIVTDAGDMGSSDPAAVGEPTDSAPVDGTPVEKPVPMPVAAPKTPKKGK